MEKKTSLMNSDGVKFVKLGVRLVGLAAAAYFFLGPKGREHRENTKAWAIKMKADVIEKLETAHDISEFAYHEIIDSVAAKHEKSKKASPEEIRELAGNLKKHWKTISKPVKAVKLKALSGQSKSEKEVK